MVELIRFFVVLIAHELGRAGISVADGRLTTQKPTSAGTDGYEYDPRNPTPTKGGLL